MMPFNIRTLALALLTIPKTFSQIADPTSIKNIGFLTYPTFEPLDIVGPLESFLSISGTRQLKIHWIAPTKAPVSNQPLHSTFNPYNSRVALTLLPTHDYAHPPALDILVVPGGTATLDPDATEVVNAAAEFVKKIFPTLKFLLTVCTGSGIAAKSGVLDGKKATTNKKAWNQTVVYSDNVIWIPKARWVVDGNVWTTSGVSAGMDGALDLIKFIWGEKAANDSTTGMEYDRHYNASWDPFAEYWGVS